jgi:ATP-binding cassette subfamily B protein
MNQKSAAAASPETRPAMSTAEARRRLFSYLGRKKGQWMLVVVALTVASTVQLYGLGLLQPLTTLAESIAQNPATRDTDLRQVQIIILVLIACVVFSQVVFYRSYAQIARLGQQLGADLRADFYTHLMQQGPAFYRRRGVGELLTIGLNDVETITTFLSQEAPSLLNLLLQLILTVAFMFMLDWRLTVGSLIFAALLYVVSTYVLVPRIGQGTKRYGQQFAAANSELNENLTGARDIQIFNQQARTAREWRERLQEMADTLARSHDLTYLNNSFAHMLTQLGLALIYGLGVLGVINGLFKVGLLISFAAYFQQFINPIRSAGGLIVKIQSTLIAAGRVFDVLAVAPEVREAANPRDPGQLKGHIQFENVTFGYDATDPTAWRIKNINLDILPGEKVAFVGGSGSGKSTLLQMVMRFYDPLEGRVTIDGHDLRDLSLAALRRNFGLVAQNVLLFHGTVADNIRFGQPEAGAEAVAEAAKIGQVTEFIHKLDHGYDTMLGELGQGLSGGQKQRVSIARAALLKPSLLVLDEATSALDTQSEEAVTRALDRLSEGRTTLVITHRLNTIRNADKIVVLDTDLDGNGFIRAVGHHDELMETSPEYVALVGRARRKGILMPIGPQYDTTPALATVIGLAQAFSAPVHILDFGAIEQKDVQGKHYGVTVVPGRELTAINMAHRVRVAHLHQKLTNEGFDVNVVSPPDPGGNWVDNTVKVIDQTEASHLVATDNVMIPMEALRESIQKIQRKTAVEYILVNPVEAAG